MNLQQFIEKVKSGQIQVVVGGKDKTGQLVSGVCTDADALTDEELAAEAISLDVAGSIEVPFDQLVDSVNEARNTELSEFSARARKKKRIYKRKKPEDKPTA